MEIRRCSKKNLFKRSSPNFHLRFTRLSILDRGLQNAPVESMYVSYQDNIIDVVNNISICSKEEGRDHIYKCKASEGRI